MFMAKCNNLQDTLFATAESIGWSCEEEHYANGDYIRFGKYSSAGEDFSFSVECENILQGVRDYVDSFDVDDHISMWLEAGRSGFGGVPRAKILFEDAEAIEQMLTELAESLVAAADEFDRDTTLDAKLKDADMCSTKQTVDNVSQAKTTPR